MPLKTVTNKMPGTPSRQVKLLKSELDKKDAENDNLKSNILDLTKALDSLQIISSKISDKGFINNSKDEKKTRKKKDANAPAPATTAYRYYSDYITQIKKEECTPEQLRTMWKECQGNERKKYTDLAALDKIRFDEMNAVYQESISEKKTEDKALEKFYEKQKQDMAMEFFEAHLQAQNAKAELEKKKKKVKAADAPKGAKSSYMFFCQETREEITAQNPGMNAVDAAKILGEQWQKLEKGKRGKNGTDKYDKMAAKDKARYTEEKKIYDEKMGVIQQKHEEERQMQVQKDKEEAMKMLEESEKERSEAIACAVAEMTPVEVSKASKETEPKKKITKKKKDPNAPKKAWSAYIFFTTENRDKIKSQMDANTSNQQLLSEVGRQWKQLSEKEKNTYVQKAEKDKVRYQKEMEEYQKN